MFITVYGLFQQFGAPIVFFAALIETTLGLGMVFPGQQIMFLGGAASAKGSGSLVLMIVLSTAGTILGDVISYTVGRWWADWLFSTRFGPHLRVGAAMMQGRARWLIPFYHFYSVTRSVGPAAAGALRLPIRVWLPLDMLGATIFNCFWVTGGFLFGTVLLRDDGTLKESPIIRIGLVVLAMAWFLVMQRIFEQKMREMQHLDATATATPAGPDAELALPEQGQSDSDSR